MPELKTVSFAGLDAMLCEPELANADLNLHVYRDVAALYMYVYKTHCQGHQDPSKRVSIFLGETEANVKMVSINGVSIPR